MSNDYGLKCPACGQTTKFEITAHHAATINGHDDVESDDANYWDDSSYVVCLECGNGDTVGDFHDDGEE